MKQSGDLKSFLHSLDPAPPAEDGETDNPLAGAQPAAPKVDALAAAAARHNLESEPLPVGVQRSDDEAGGIDVEQGGGGLDAPVGEEGPPAKKSGCPCLVM